MTKILVIVGPTAVGKSALAMEMAERLDGEIINADALQVYRGLEIGTAKPSLADRQRVPHHLVDILDPTESYSAADFARRAHQAIVEIEARNRLPIVVGGSGLYIRALLEGLSPIPAIDPAIRRWQNRELERNGLASGRRALLLHDLDLAERLPLGDTQRTLRGVEVALATGHPLSWWQTLARVQERPLNSVVVGLTLQREFLYDRIAERVSRMLDLGWVQEVQNLLDAGLEPCVPAFQAIGYRQLAHYLVGGGGLKEAREEIIVTTRRFAKRQLTWFRRQSKITWISDGVSEVDRARIAELL